ncbi:hypothetical protein [Streptomyces sp. NPDC048650]|uniref:helix-turn-helix transcriptional regulator n=1 Tax=unclassified Streptomyces TaxID=2593676 RepID=UPI0037160843
MTGSPSQQVEEWVRRAERRIGPRLTSVTGGPTKGDLADHHPGVEYFELAEGMFRTARREVLIVNGQMNGFPREDIDRFRGSVAALSDGPTAVSVICHPDELDGHDRQEFLARISRENDAQVRISTVDVQGMMIFDRRYALMWRAKHGRSCLLVHSPVIVEPLLKLLDSAWEGACDLETFVRHHQNMLDEKTPQILRLLSSGRKDEVAARQLGISVRTYRRHVAGLMEILGAESRFEAGVKATALGLIDVDLRGGVSRPPAPSAPPAPPARAATPGVPRQRTRTATGLAPEVPGDAADDPSGCTAAPLAMRRVRRGGSTPAPWAARWCPS